MVDKYPYAQAPNKIPKLFHKIKEAGVPVKATHKWLESIGFTSSNDRTLLRVLKYINFVDELGAPTQLWRDFRGGNSGAVLSQALKEAYKELFSTYPSACAQSDNDLLIYFRKESGASKDVAQKMLSTFKKLCEMADFNAIAVNSASRFPSSKQRQTSSEPAVSVEEPIVEPCKPTLHIDLQVHISPEMDEAKIKAIFKYMAEYIFGYNM